MQAASIIGIILTVFVNQGYFTLQARYYLLLIYIYQNTLPLPVSMELLKQLLYLESV